MASGSGPDVEYVYVFIHGFLSSAASDRGEDFMRRVRRRDITLYQLDGYHGKEFKDVSVSLYLQSLDEFYEKKGSKPLRIIAADIGAYVAAYYASKHPERVNKLAFLCGAFNLKETWKSMVGQLDPTTLANWERTGSLIWTQYQSRERVEVPYSCFLDSLQYPDYPLVRCPVRSYFGAHDNAVPPSVHRTFKEKQENPDLVELVELEDELNLYLYDSFAKMYKEIPEFFLGTKDDRPDYYYLY